ncbi:hypothetical protein HDU85_005121 [Gaertneriomyces sp. JEL0708]|nr:hypothetical protein HDU85_005121 [Gaertneriomyces sp. JEL0708]
MPNAYGRRNLAAQAEKLLQSQEEYAGTAFREGACGSLPLGIRGGPESIRILDTISFPADEYGTQLMRYTFSDDGLFNIDGTRPAILTPFHRNGNKWLSCTVLSQEYMYTLVPLCSWKNRKIQLQEVIAHWNLAACFAADTPGGSVHGSHEPDGCLDEYPHSVCAKIVRGKLKEDAFYRINPVLVHKCFWFPTSEQILQAKEARAEEKRMWAAPIERKGAAFLHLPTWIYQVDIMPGSFAVAIMRLYQVLQALEADKLTINQVPARCKWIIIKCKMKNAWLRTTAFPEDRFMYRKQAQLDLDYIRRRREKQRRQVNALLRGEAETQRERRFRTEEMDKFDGEDWFEVKPVQVFLADKRALEEQLALEKKQILAKLEAAEQDQACENEPASDQEPPSEQEHGCEQGPASDQEPPSEQDQACENEPASDQEPPSEQEHGCEQEKASGTRKRMSEAQQLIEILESTVCELIKKLNGVHDPFAIERKRRQAVPGGEPKKKRKQKSGGAGGVLENEAA